MKWTKGLYLRNKVGDVIVAISWKSWKGLGFFFFFALLYQLLLAWKLIVSESSASGAHLAHFNFNVCHWNSGGVDANMSAITRKTFHLYVMHVCVPAYFHIDLLASVPFGALA